MKAKYRKFSTDYIKHLASLPQNRNMRTYQKWIRRQRKHIKVEKQICHVVYYFKVKKFIRNFGVEE